MCVGAALVVLLWHTHAVLLACLCAVVLLASLCAAPAACVILEMQPTVSFWHVPCRVEQCI